MRYEKGFTILEMVVVLVMMGFITSLAMPGLQQMYGSMSRALVRNELHSTLNGLALAVRKTGRPFVLTSYPQQPSVLPQAFSDRLSLLGVRLSATKPILITATGFCPEGGVLLITQGEYKYSISLRSPDCRASEP